MYILYYVCIWSKSWITSVAAATATIEWVKIDRAFLVSRTSCCMHCALVNRFERWAREWFAHTNTLRCSSLIAGGTKYNVSLLHFFLWSKRGRSVIVWRISTVLSCALCFLFGHRMSFAHVIQAKLFWLKLAIVAQAFLGQISSCSILLRCICVHDHTVNCSTWWTYS